MKKFADPHIHGGWGYSFQKAEFAPLEEKLRSQGIVFAIPTLMNDSFENLEKIGKKFLAYRDKNPDSIFPFLRVEGPFISPGRAGAQEKEYILTPERENIRLFLSLPGIKMFTFAPEVEGATLLVSMATEAGKIPSVGHSNATYGDVLRAYRMGVRHFTHFPNALRGLHHREIGAVGAGLLLEGVHLEVIGDLVHTSLDFIKLLLKIKGPSFSLVSDMLPRGPSPEPIRDGKGMLMGGGLTVPHQAEKLRSSGLGEDALKKLCLLNALSFFNPENPDVP